MSFGNLTIWVLSLFWVVPIIILFYIYTFRKKSRLMDAFCKAPLRDKIMPQYSPGRQWVSAILIILSIILIIFAFLRPRWGFHWEEIKRFGIDIIVAVDCSQSMMAEDVQPNRLERAKRELQDLLNMLDGDRIGLVAFAGNSFVQCPLTLDYGAFRIFLDYLDTDLIPVQGTAISLAIQEAIGCFDRTQKGSKAIILITDGEEHEGDPIEAATEAKNKGIKIFTIGIGKEGGAPIPEPDGSGFKKDREGNVILTKLDEKTLQRIALETGGSYVRSVTGDLDLEKIYKEGIKGMEHKELTSTKKRIWEERFQWFLFFAALLLIIELLFPERRKVRIKKMAQGSSMLLLIPIIITLVCLINKPLFSWAALLPSSRGKEAERHYNTQEYEKALSTFLDAQIDSPDDPYLQYNIGNTYYRMNNYEEAEKNFLTAANSAPDIELEAKSYYNLGNCTYRMGKLDEAVNWYMKALELKPDDEDARYNLEFVREEIKRRINEAMEQQKNQEKEGDKQDKTCNSPTGQGDQQVQQQKEEQAGTQGQQQKQAGAEEKQQEKGQQEGEEKKEIQAAEARKGAGKDEKDEEKGEQEGTQAAAQYKEISPEEAQALLDSLEDDKEEKKKRMTGHLPKSAGPVKDW